jgi:anthranilate phosphoribosyltransferase
VVHGHDGLDELTTTGPSQMSTFGLDERNGDVITETLDPLDLGFSRAQPADLVGGEPAENAQITRDVLSGVERGPCRDVVLLNAAAALWVGGVAPDIEAGVARAAESIDSGAALDKLEALTAYSQRAAT